MDNPSDIDELKQLRKKISNLMAEIAGRDEAIEAMERRIRAEESQHKGCKGALTKFFAELAANDELFETMDKAMIRLCDDNVKLSDEYDELQKMFTAAAAHAEELELGTEELNNQIEDLNKRIIAIREEHGYKITTDQIRAAWKRMNRLRNSENNAEHFMGRGIEAALKQDFCIVRCGGCNGYGSLDGNPFDDDSEPDNTCPDCNGEGFVIGGEDE